MNRMLLLAARPVGDVKQSDFELVEAPIPEPGPGEFVAEVTDISLDPAMRSWMNAGRSYIPPVQIGDVMRAYAIGRVIASRHDGFVAGDLVHGLFGVQEFALSDGAGVLKIEPTDGIPRTAHLGVLGLTGMTAYFGLLDVGRFEAGQTVLVSGAAGAVGMTVGQIAKIKGGTAVGIAGGTEKCRLLVEELGFDAAIDYKAGDLLAQMRERTPDRVDVFFDNVGGTILDAGLTRIGHGARVVICGAISQYNNTTAVTGPSNYLSLLTWRASMAGFIAYDYVDRYPDAVADLSRWLTEGRLTNIEHPVRGDIEAFPDVFQHLFAGQNTGKLVLEIKP